MAKEGKGSLGRVAVLGVTLVILLIPFALYYLLYVSSQQAYFTNRSHRSLASIGDQVAKRIDGLCGVVENVAKKQCSAEGKEDSGDISNAEGKQDSGDIKDLEEYFNEKALRPFDVALSFKPGAPLVKEETKSPELGLVKPAVTVQFKKNGAADLLVLDYEVTAEDDLMPGRFSVSARTNDLLEPVAARYLIRERQPAVEDLFDKVFIADSETGEVIFQFGYGLPIIISNSDELVSANSSSSGKTGEKDAETGKELRGKIDRGMSGMIPVTIANIDYKLFFQPIQLTAPKTVGDDQVQAADGVEVNNLFEKYDKNKDRKITAEEFGNERVFKWMDLNKDGELTRAEADTALKQLKKASDNEGNQGFKLMVFGVVRADYALKKTLAFTSYMLLLLAVLFVLITTGSGPLIKLRLLGPKDRLRKADGVFAVLSIFFVTALLTLTVLDSYTHITTEGQLDRQLKQLSGKISGNLRYELASAIYQLDQLNNQLNYNLDLAFSEVACGVKDSGVNDKQSGTTTSGENVAPKENHFLEEILHENLILDSQNAPYTYFNSVTWIDRYGQQRIKFTTRRKRTSFIDVFSRSYFTEANERRTWELPLESPGETPLTFYLESVNSLTSGDNVAVISKRTPDDKYVVSAMDTRLLSLYEPVLPAGYGFCVIDDAGRVVFHSDDVKNLRENFFDECSNDRGLRAAVKARVSEALDVKYLGRDHRVFAAPLQGLPWTLVVFRDKQILRTVNLDIMTLTGIAGLAYVALLTLALSFIFVFLPQSKQRRTNLWPVKERREQYMQMLIVNSSLFVICMLLVSSSGQVSLIIWAILFPTLAIAHSLWLLGEKRGKLPKSPDASEEHPIDTRTRWLLKLKAWLSEKLGGTKGRLKRLKSWLSDWRTLYSLAWVSMLAIGCLAPTLTFFKLMREEQVKVFLRHGQMSLARGLEARESRVRRLYSSSDAPIDVGAAKEAFITERLNNTWDVYGDFFFETGWKERARVDGKPLGGILCWFLTTFSPFYNEVCVENLELVRDQSSDKSWISSEEGDTLLLVVRPITTLESQSGETPAEPGAPPGLDASSQQSGDGAGLWPILRSKVPAFIDLSNPRSWLLLPAFALLLIGAYFAVRFVARRIVLLDLAHIQTVTVDLTNPIEKNYMVVGPPSFDHAKLFPKERFVHIDLASSSEMWWRVVNNVERDGSNLPLVLDRFDFNERDWKLNQLKLELVERLLNQGTRRLIIISSRDPVEFPLSDAKLYGPGSAATGDGIAKVLGTGGGTGAALSPVPGQKPDPERWSALLGSFARATALERDDPQACGLLKVSGEPAISDEDDSEDAGNPDDDERIAEVADQRDMCYRGIWSACSLNERVTLYRVAKDGLAGRLDPDLRRLMQRRLIVRNPSLRLMDPSFRTFVLKTSAVDNVDKLLADEQSSWDRWKLPLLFVLLAMIIFLFGTQKELYDNTISVVTAVTGGLLALFRLVGVFQTKGGGGASSQD